MAISRERIGKQHDGPSGLAIPLLAVREAVHFPRHVNTVHVVREASLKSVRKALNEERLVLVVCQQDITKEDPLLVDLFKIGTVSEVLQALPMPDGGMRVVLRGLSRAEILGLETRSGTTFARIEAGSEEAVKPLDELSEALMRMSVESFTQLVQVSKGIPSEAIDTVTHQDRPGPMADAIAHHLAATPLDKQKVLTELNGVARLRIALELIKREEQVLSYGAQIREEVERELGESQREFYLREQLKIIQDELDRRDNRPGEERRYLERIEGASMPDDVKEAAREEISRLVRMPSHAAEAHVSRSYLDELLAMPWGTLTTDQLDVKHASKILDNRHSGLDSVKERILDLLSVQQLRGRVKGEVLCFVGPPGVGKTSFARSIAEALGRKFVRVALGGVRDEAEIRGHRRTYVGAAVGRIAAGLRSAGSMNPVFVLDEIDKLAHDFRGDPMSALLEALDAEQNSQFTDHYLGVPLDLSQVLFVATANVLDSVPPALRDRLEVIEFSSYSDREREKILTEFIWPEALAEHGLKGLALAPESIKALVTDYSREAGVRRLKQQVNTICRKMARAQVEGERFESVELAQVRKWLREPVGRSERVRADAEIGLARGLVVSEYGGDVIDIEVSLLPKTGERPEIQSTGNLGAVMRESVNAALTAVRSLLDVPLDRDIHLHIPEGGIPKDGPSAGVCIAVAIASVLTGRKVLPDIAMTGEITLRGDVLPIGGTRDKILAAHRSGFKRVLIPKGNEPDLDVVPDYVKSQIEIISASSLREVLSLCLQP